MDSFSSSHPIPTHPEPGGYNHHHHHSHHNSPSPPVSSGESDRGRTSRDQTPNRMKRPGLLTERSSSTLIVPRDSPQIELQHEEYGPHDARSMSPRRTSEEVDRLGENARQALLLQAKMLQDNLLQIVDKVETVKSEHEKLEGGNKFLQSYIGELMQTSKITSSGSKLKGKGKGKSK